MRKNNKKIIDKLAEISGTDSDDWFLVSRARHGMEIVFREMAKINSKGEVITQPFTCATAINPIFTASLKPIYADIKVNNLSIDPASVNNRISKNSIGVVVQHTMGLRASVEEISKISREKDLIIVEDSAHCLGRVSKEFVDISIHSFGSEKILPTNFGGAVWINPYMKNHYLRERLRKSLESLPAMTFIEVVKYLSYRPLNKIINVLPSRINNKVKSLLQRSGLLITPIMPIEQRTINYMKPKKLPNILSKAILANLRDLDNNKVRRRASVNVYQRLQNNDFIYNNDDTYVRFPLLAKTDHEANNVFDVLRSKGIPAGKWYRPLLFPGVNEKLYLYNKDCPVAEKCSKLIINLPTNISEEMAKKAVNEINSIRA